MAHSIYAQLLSIDSQTSIAVDVSIAIANN